MVPYGVSTSKLPPPTPIIVRNKAVFPRPGLEEFLQEISLIAACVVVWSSMIKRNAEDIAGVLFPRFRESYDILGQEYCRKIEIAKGKFLKYMDNRQKPIFLKVLADQLFSNPSGSTSFDVDNTLLIDNSSEKNICDDPSNAIFLRMWSGQVDNNELMGIVAPWLRQLHKECRSTELRQYMKSN